MTTRTRAWSTLGALILICGGMSACTLEASSEESLQTADGDIGETTLAIGEAACATISPATTVADNLGFSHTSPQSYDPAGCHKGYILHSNKFINHKAFSIGWGDASPTTAAACGASKVLGYLYVNGVLVDSRSATGAWGPHCDAFGLCEGPSYCHTANVTLTHSSVSGKAVRVVASARTSASGATRKVSVASYAPIQ